MSDSLLSDRLPKQPFPALRLRENALGYVLYEEAWHSGVVGIVASRVSRLHNRPCIVLGNDGAYQGLGSQCFGSRSSKGTQRL